MTYPRLGVPAPAMGSEFHRSNTGVAAFPFRPVALLPEGSHDAPPADPPADPPEDPDDRLGDAGKKALDDERTARKAAERTAKPWTKLAEEFGITPDEARDILAKAKPKGDPPQDEPVDADKIRRAAQKEADAKANARIVRAEVRAMAADSFANPADALHNLDLTDYEVDEDGNLIDAAKVKADLADVLKANPHYAKGGRGPKPDPSQGPRGDKPTDPGPGVARLRHAYAQTAK